MASDSPVSPAGAVPERNEPRWLDPVQQKQWRNFLEAARGLIDEIDRQMQADAGMPNTYFEIMVVLSEADEYSMRMSALAEALLSSPSRLSHAVSRLEERQCVIRRRATTDRRGQWVTLTSTGLRVLDEAAGSHVEVVRRCVVDAMDAQQLGQLDAISTIIRQAISDGR